MTLSSAGWDIWSWNVERKSGIVISAYIVLFLSPNFCFAFSGTLYLPNKQHGTSRYDHLLATRIDACACQGPLWNGVQGCLADGVPWPAHHTLCLLVYGRNLYEWRPYTDVHDPVTKRLILVTKEPQRKTNSVYTFAGLSFISVQSLGHKLRKCSNDILREAYDNGIEPWIRIRVKVRI